MQRWPGNRSSEETAHAVRAAVVNVAALSQIAALADDTQAATHVPKLAGLRNERTVHVGLAHKCERVACARWLQNGDGEYRKT